MLARSFLRIFITGLLTGSIAAQMHAAPVAGGTLVRNFVLTSERVQSFGKFTAIERAVVRPGTALHLYGEPGDFGWHRQGAVANFNVTVGVQVRRSDGRAVANSVSPLVLKHQAADRPREFFFSLSLNINAPVGLYTIDVTMRDPTNEQAVRKSFPVRVSYLEQQQHPPSRTNGLSAAAQTPDAAAPDRAKTKPAVCRKYFAQIGDMIDVPCEH